MKWLWVGVLLIASLTASAQSLRFGFGTHKPPYIYENQGRGLEYDIVMTAAELGGLKVEPYYAPMERLSMMMRKGQLDAVATTHERNGDSPFYSDVYIRYQNVAVALRSRNLRIERISDLAAYSVNAFHGRVCSWAVSIKPWLRATRVTVRRPFKSRVTACSTVGAWTWW